MAHRLGQGDLVAPSLLWFEMASIFLEKTHDPPGTAEALGHTYGLLDRLAIQPAAVDHPATVNLAEQTCSAVYDASYLWLAQSLSAELVTLDQLLRTAHARR